MSVHGAFWVWCFDDSTTHLIPRTRTHHAPHPTHPSLHSTHHPTTQATHQDLANKLYTTTTVSESGRFSKPKLSQTEFTIAHYAGPVTYRCDNFLDKNKDFVVAEQQELLGNSTYEFVRSLFPADAAPEDGKVCVVWSRRDAAHTLYAHGVIHPHPPHSLRTPLISYAPLSFPPQSSPVSSPPHLSPLFLPPGCGQGSGQVCQCG